MIKRENVYNNQIIITDGMWGSGKSLLAPLISVVEGVEKWKCDPNFEYTCTLHYLKLLSEESASTMLRLYSDWATYDSYISREVNFRFHDESGVFNNPKKLKYLFNLFKKDEGNVGEEILSLKPVLHIMTHNILPISKPLVKAFGGRLKLIVMMRNPVYMMKYWCAYLPRYGKDPTELDIYIGDKGDIPWYIKDVKKYNNLRPMERAIESYKDLLDSTLKVEKEGFLNKDSLLVIPFESFTLDSETWIYKIKDFLGLKDHFDFLLEEIKDQISSSYFQELIEFIKKYKQKYAFSRQMPWDNI